MRCYIETGYSTRVEERGLSTCRVLNGAVTEVPRFESSPLVETKRSHGAAACPSVVFRLARPAQPSPSHRTVSSAAPLLPLWWAFQRSLFLCLSLPFLRLSLPFPDPSLPFLDLSLIFLDLLLPSLTFYCKGGKAQPDCSLGSGNARPCTRTQTCRRAGWVSVLLLEWLRNAVQPPGSRTCAPPRVVEGRRVSRRPRI